MTDNERDHEDREEYRRTVNELFRLIRENGERLVRVEVATTDIKVTLATLTTSVGVLQVEGCAIGKQHSKDIAELQSRPGRLLASAATLSGIVSAIVAAVIWLIGRETKS